MFSNRGLHTGTYSWSYTANLHLFLSFFLLLYSYSLFYFKVEKVEKVERYRKVKKIKNKGILKKDRKPEKTGTSPTLKGFVDGKRRVESLGG